jgi:hypothetical protein
MRVERGKNTDVTAGKMGYACEVEGRYDCGVVKRV